MNKRVINFAAALIVYSALAALLFCRLENFGKLELARILNMCLAAAGVYAVSRRWVAGFWGALIAGAVYGFGPYSMGVANYHPAAGFVVALVGWLFYPAVFYSKNKFRPLTVILCILPFVAIVIFFKAFSLFNLYPVPIQQKMQLADFSALLAPFAKATRSAIFVGFYHVPTCWLLMGMLLFIAAKRFGIMLVLAAGIILSAFGPILGVGPIVWLAIPVLCCSVMIGEGTEAVCSAGYADRKWLLAGSLVSVTFSLVLFFLALKYQKMYAGLGIFAAEQILLSSKMYMLGAICTGVIFFLTKAKFRSRPLRLSIVVLATAFDIVFSATLIVNTFF